MSVYLEWGKSVWGNVEGRELHVTEEAVQLFREEHRPCQWLVTQALPQHHSTVQSHFCTLISVWVNTCQVRLSHRPHQTNYKTYTVDVTQVKTGENQYNFRGKSMLKTFNTVNVALHSFFALVISRSYFPWWGISAMPEDSWLNENSPCSYMGVYW